MLIPCPQCGPRDRREFYFMGAEDYLRRPEGEAGPEAVEAQLHLRANPAGRTRELWQHECCDAWLVVERCTVTHRVFGAALLAEARDAD